MYHSNPQRNVQSEFRRWAPPPAVIDPPILFVVSAAVAERVRETGLAAVVGGIPHADVGAVRALDAAVVVCQATETESSVRRYSPVVRRVSGADLAACNTRADFLALAVGVSR